jgi:peptidoglycan/LPS O-acetylase OafA/YrhL
MTAAAPAAGSRRLSWDVLRVLAVFAVVLEHATDAGRNAHPELGHAGLTLSVQVGASVLVIMSAYFACLSLGRGRPWSFLRNRFARLLPAYLVAVVLVYVVMRLFAPRTWSPPRPVDVLLDLALLQNWTGGAHYVDFSFWTLPLQLTGFVAAAVLVALGRVRGWPLRVLLWALPVVPVVLRMCLRGRPWFDMIFDGLVLHRAQLFAVGVALFLWSAGRLRGGHLTALLLVCLVAQGIQTEDLPSTLALAGAVLLLVAAAGGPDWSGPLISPVVRPVRWLAGISFGMYLVNQQIGFVLMYQVFRLGGGWLPQVLAMVAGSVLLGWLLTITVERPAHRALTRRRVPRPVAEVPRPGAELPVGGAGAELATASTAPLLLRQPL